MDIENEIQVLRDQLAEKSSDSVHILKKVYILNPLKSNCSYNSVCIWQTCGVLLSFYFSNFTLVLLTDFIDAFYISWSCTGDLRKIMCLCMC